MVERAYAASIDRDLAALIPADLSLRDHVRVSDLWYRYPGTAPEAWTLRGIDLVFGRGNWWDCWGRPAAARPHSFV